MFFTGAFSVCRAITNRVAYRFHAELTNSTDTNDLPSIPELPLSSFAFCALYQVLKDNKSRYVNYLELPITELLYELTSLAPKISPSDPVAIKVPSSLLQKHKKYEIILERITKNATILIASASFEYQALYNLHLAEQQADAKTLAQEQGQAKRKVTFETNKAIEKESLRNRSNLKDAIGQVVQTQLQKLSKRQRKRKRQHQSKRASVATTNASGNESGGSKRPRSEPQTGKKHQGRDQNSSVKNKKRKVKDETSDTTPNGRGPPKNPSDKDKGEQVRPRKRRR
jgi:hypothetical protein